MTAAARVPSKILVDDRTNTLIVVSSEAGYLRVKALVERLDIVARHRGRRGDPRLPARERARRGARDDAQRRASSGPAQQPPAAAGQPGQPPAPRRRAGRGGGDLGSSLEGQVRVIGDKPTNSLIVMSSGRDFIAVRDVIRAPRPAAPPDLHRGADPRGPDREVARHRHELARRSAGQRRRRDRARRRADADAQVARRRRRSRSLTGLIGGLVGSPLDELADVPRHEHPVVRGAVPGAREPGQLEHPVGAAHHRDRQREGRVLGRQQHPVQGGPLVRRLCRRRPAARRRRSARSVTNIQREKLNLTLNVTPHISSNDAVRLEIEQETKDLGGKDPRARPDVGGAQAEDAGRRARPGERRDRRPDPGARDLQRHEGAAARRHPDPRLPVQVLDASRRRRPTCSSCSRRTSSRTSSTSRRSASARCASTASSRRRSRTSTTRSTSRRSTTAASAACVEEINRVVLSVEEDRAVLDARGRAPATCIEGDDRVRPVGHRVAGRRSRLTPPPGSRRADRPRPRRAATHGAPARRRRHGNRLDGDVRRHTRSPGMRRRRSRARIGEILVRRCGVAPDSIERCARSSARRAACIGEVLVRLRLSTRISSRSRSRSSSTCRTCAICRAPRTSRPS